MVKKEVRCPDCDYVLVNKDGKDTDVLFALTSKDLEEGTEIGICRKCGSIVFIRDKEDLEPFEDMGALDVFIFKMAAIEILKEKNIKIENLIREFNQKEKTFKTDKTTKKVVKFEDLFNSVERPITENKLAKIPDADNDSLINNKYILLSGRHDSWKIFNSEKELTEELSKIPANADILVYELGSEKKLKYNVSLV